MSSRVAETLEILFAPGKRFRLSPLVEATQLQVLFGCAPDPQNRAESIQQILRRPDVTNRIERLAAQWEQFCRSGKPFSAATTYDRGFLEVYLTYYATVNVPKLQAVLIELVRQGKLSGTLRVLDIGVGPGTTALAVLDFLLVWEAVCRLWNEPFPVTGVELIGIDRNQAALDYAAHVTRTFANQVDQWRTTRREAIAQRGAEALQAAQATTAWAEQVIAAARAARWERIDVTDRASVPRLQQHARRATLVVASYVLNEVRDSGAEEQFTQVIAATQPGTVTLVLEAGSKDPAQGLMRWRRQLLARYPRFRSLGPCGQEFGTQLPVCCDRCWPGRREGLHQPALYRKFVDAAKHSWQGASSRFDELENQLLSWCYVMLEHTATPAQAASVQPITPPRAGEQRSFLTRSLGYVRHHRPIAETPLELFEERSGRAVVSAIKLCPATLGCQQALLRRDPGRALPQLRFGEPIRVTATIVEATIRGEVILSVTEQGHGVERCEPAHDERAERHIAQDLAEPAWLPPFTPTMHDALDDLAYWLFGFPALRPFQHVMLERVLTGRSTLGIAATGSGKSECFIMPALLLPGFTVVVSPLKSLMQDQFEQRIRGRYGFDGVTAYLNGDIPLSQRDWILQCLAQGSVKLLYVTPEQLERDWVINALKMANERVPGGFRYLAVDEAHCISQWGHDFRPAYLNILRRLAAHHLRPTVIALTATASPQVRDDLAQELQLNPESIEHGGDVLFDTANRPELNLVVRLVSDATARAEDMLAQLRRLRQSDPHGAAIVFQPWTSPTSNPDKPEPVSPYVTNFAAWLEQALGEPVAIYHGKMEEDPRDGQPDDAAEHANYPVTLGNFYDRTRQEEQRRFLDGQRAIMVATKGFGMGVDKPNIRLVLHRTPPSTIEAYWQEAGRAGRDGKLATVIVYFALEHAKSPAQSATAPPASQRDDTVLSDVDIQEHFIEQRYVQRAAVEAMVAFLQTRPTTRVGTCYFTGRAVREYLKQHHARALTSRSSLGHEPLKPDGKYIDRILQALQSYRIRDGAREVAFLDAVHECSGLLDKVVLPAGIDALFTSTYYFGDLLRQMEQHRPGFRQQFAALLSQKPVDLTKLADLLEMPMHETLGLLYDIRSAEGQKEPDPKTGQPRWRGRLLDFPPSALSQRGWEVRLGNAFADPTHLPRYIDEFVALMERRRNYDEEAYHRFLTEYIGVEQRGNHWVKREGPLPCLRSVILGYLKTGETVIGENCFSCSRCVPNLNFITDLDARQRVVQRLADDLAALLAELEQRRTEWPSIQQLTELAALVNREVAAGRRIGGYLLGWTDRLLSDTPDHRTATAIRLFAAGRGWIQLPPDEVMRLAETCAKEATAADQAIFDALLLEATTASLPTVPLLHRMRADWLVRTGRWPAAADELHALLQSPAVSFSALDRCDLTWRLVLWLDQLHRDRTMLRWLRWLAWHEPRPDNQESALERLIAHFLARGQEGRARVCARRHARLARDRGIARHWYQRAGIADWPATRVVRELGWIQRHAGTSWQWRAPMLLQLWLTAHPQQLPHFADTLSQAPWLPHLTLTEWRTLRQQFGPLDQWANLPLAPQYAAVLAAHCTQLSAAERHDLIWWLSTSTNQPRELVDRLVADSATLLTTDKRTYELLVDALRGSLRAILKLVRRCQNTGTTLRWLPALLTSDVAAQAQERGLLAQLVALALKSAQDMADVQSILAAITPWLANETIALTVLKHLARAEMIDKLDPKQAALLGRAFIQHHSTDQPWTANTVELAVRLARQVAVTDPDAAVDLLTGVTIVVGRQLRDPQSTAAWSAWRAALTTPPMPQHLLDALWLRIATSDALPGADASYLASCVAFAAGHDRAALLALAHALEGWLSLPDASLRLHLLSLLSDALQQLVTRTADAELLASLSAQFVEAACRCPVPFTHNVALQWWRTYGKPLIAFVPPAMLARLAIEEVGTPMLTAFLDVWQEVMPAPDDAWTAAFQAACAERIFRGDELFLVGALLALRNRPWISAAWCDDLLRRWLAQTAWGSVPFFVWPPPWRAMLLAWFTKHPSVTASAIVRKNRDALLFITPRLLLQKPPETVRIALALYELLQNDRQTEHSIQEITQQVKLVDAELTVVMLSKPLCAWVQRIIAYPLSPTLITEATITVLRILAGHPSILKLVPTLAGKAPKLTRQVICTLAEHDPPDCPFLMQSAHLIRTLDTWLNGTARLARVGDSTERATACTTLAQLLTPVCSQDEATVLAQHICRYFNIVKSAPPGLSAQAAALVALVNKLYYRTGRRVDNPKD